MLFGNKNQATKQQHNNAALRQKQCGACPLVAHKTPDVSDYPIDILVISEPMSDLITKSVTNYDTRHVFTVECGGLTNQAPISAVECCAGRKLDMITRLKPKVVITVGYGPHKLIEEALGHDAPGSGTDLVPLPCRLKGHTFWSFNIPDHEPFGALIQSQKIIAQMVQNAPTVTTGDISGISFATTLEDIDRAFDDLEQYRLLACDIETVGLRPYGLDAKLLTIAISNGVGSYGFPLQHSQAPRLQKIALVQHVLERFYKLVSATKRRIIFHNGAFELEWFADYLGDQFLYEGTWEDTMAQAFLLSDGPKSLDWLIRRHFGFSLKKMSNIDVTKLDQMPLDMVLKYNCLDAKYTYLLYRAQEKLLAQEGLQTLYRDTQMERLPAFILMQHLGLMPDFNFIQHTSTVFDGQLQNALQHFKTYDEVREFNTVNKRACNPLSDSDIRKLFYEQFGVSSEVESFDESFLSTFNHSIADNILSIREANKIFSTYLAPLNPRANHKNAGKFIWPANLQYPDGVIHTQYNSMRVVTGRSSSSNPNVQNFTARDGKKYLRDVIRAPHGHTMVAIDYGQIEYRIIAVLSQDPVMLNAILNGLDIHKDWAQRIIELFPKLFGHYQGAKFDEFRSRIKNSLVFPFCYGASPKKVGDALGISEHKAKVIAKEFWDKHQTVEQWHKRLHYEMQANGFVGNPFGRKFRPPLSKNQVINYPVQSTASDIVVTAMSRLCRMSIEQLSSKWYLAPVINIHDSLEFYIPTEKLETAIQEILSIMLDVSLYPWLNVPLTAEVSTGPSWGSLKKYGVYSSEDF